MLERTRIRHDVVDRLIKADTKAGDNVFKSRLTNIPENLLPAISVYTLSEIGADAGGIHLPSFNTNTTLKIDVSVADSEGWDDSLDNLCEEVETALLNDPDFVRQFSRFSSYSTQIQLESGGETPIATAVIAIGLEYRSVFEPTIPDQLETTRFSVVDTNKNQLLEAEIKHEQ